MTQVRCSGGASPCVAVLSPWVPLSVVGWQPGPKIAQAAAAFPAPVPAAPLTSGSGASSRVSSGRNPRLEGGRGCTTGGTGQRDTSVGLGSHQDWGPGALLEWRVPGPSSASSCGCGCRALPRSSTLRAGMSAGRCHGDPHLCRPISWGLSSPRGFLSIPPSMDRGVQPGTGRVQRLGWCWGAWLGHVWVFGASIPSPGFISHSPSEHRQWGSMGPMAKLTVGKDQCNKPQRALGADVP